MDGSVGKWSHDRLIFNTGIPIHGRDGLYNWDGAQIFLLRRECERCALLTQAKYKSNLKIKTLNTEMPCSISLDSGNEQEIIIESSKNKGPTKNDISLRYTRPVLLIRNGFHMFPCRNQNIGFKSRFPDSEWQFSHMHVLNKKNSRSR